jgi:hypothetical protein
VVFLVGVNYLNRLRHDFFSISRPYYILKNCPNMNLSNTCPADFIKTTLVLISHICRIQGGVSGRSPLFEETS